MGWKNNRFITVYTKLEDVCNRLYEDEFGRGLEGRNVVRAFAADLPSDADEKLLNNLVNIRNIITHDELIDVRLRAIGSVKRFYKLAKAKKKERDEALRRGWSLRR